VTEEEFRIQLAVGSITQDHVDEFIENHRVALRWKKGVGPIYMYENDIEDFDYEEPSNNTGLRAPMWFWDYFFLQNTDGLLGMSLPERRKRLMGHIQKDTTPGFEDYWICRNE